MDSLKTDLIKTEDELERKDRENAALLLFVDDIRKSLASVTVCILSANDTPLLKSPKRFPEPVKSTNSVLISNLKEVLHDYEEMNSRLGAYQEKLRNELQRFYMGNGQKGK